MYVQTRVGPNRHLSTVHPLQAQRMRLTRVPAQRLRSAVELPALTGGFSNVSQAPTPMTGNRQNSFKVVLVGWSSASTWKCKSDATFDADRLQRRRRREVVGPTATHRGRTPRTRRLTFAMSSTSAPTTVISARTTRRSERRGGG
jgi:hypothetical protein